MTEGPFDLTAHAPARCDFGHVIRYGGRDGAAFIPGRITASFVMCDCPEAMAKPGASGHVQVSCEGCRSEGRVTRWRDPPCERER